MKLYGVKMCLDNDLAYDLNLIDTCKEYGLALSSDDFSISEPVVRTEYKQVRGMDGALDVSDAPHGFPVFENRTIKFKLFKCPTPFMAVDINEMMALRSTLMAAFQGQVRRIIFPYDETHYWVGRITLGQMDFGNGIFEFTAVVHPYRLKVIETEYDFDTLTTSDQYFTMTNERKYVIPEITVFQDTVIQMMQGVTSIPDAVTLTVEDGESSATYQLPELMLIDGTNRMMARCVSESSGEILVYYREGTL